MESYLLGPLANLDFGVHFAIVGQGEDLVFGGWNVSRVLVAMSGGVDSSVAALLLKQAGYDCVGVFLRTGAQTKAASRGCCSVEDARDARLVADRLGIPFYALDAKQEFSRIIDYFVAEYSRGRTPNPCAVCNQWLKFGELFEIARELGADKVATGHYARIEAGSIRRGLDAGKDQSYFLFGIGPAVLERVLFPVGALPKSRVRELAEEAQLPVFGKPDSQEICFVPGNDYRNVLRERAPETLQPGEIVDEQGTPVGTHEGVAGFTIGQRRGLGVALGYPAYVLELDVETRRVKVGAKQHLLRTDFRAEPVAWYTEPLEAELDCTVQVRYRHRPVACRVRPSDGELQVALQTPVPAITPGQAAVFYRDDVVLGGGWICS